MSNTIVFVYNLMEIKMAAGKGGVELALVLFGIFIRLKPSVDLQSNISYVKPESLGLMII
jgi:hypothetical protein